MQRLRSLVSRYRMVLGALAAALVLLLAAAWTGYDLSFQVDGRSEYLIQNDDYSRTVRLTDRGLDQTLKVSAGQTLYGVRLNFTTYDYAFRDGTLTAELCSADGERLTGMSRSLVGLLDDTFADLVFDVPYTAAEDTVLHLKLTCTTNADGFYPLGLWTSRGVADDQPLTDGDGRAYNGTLAVQYITNYSGTVSADFAAVLGVLIAAAGALAFLLLFHFRAKLAAVFAAAALLLGVGFAVLTPPMVAPDEYTHLAVSYLYASIALDEPACNEDQLLLVRECDAPHFKTATGDIGIFAYKQYADHLFDTGNDGATTAQTEAYADTSRLKPLYYGQILGVWLARKLGLGYYAMVLFGRLGNLLVYLLLATCAVALAPKRYKAILACVGLLPMSLQLAGSFSADATVLGLLFSFTAVFLKLREGPSRPYIPLLVICTLAVAPVKAIYLPVTLLVLLIPSEHLDPRRKPDAPTVALARRWQVRPGLLVKLAALMLAAGLWCLVNLGSLLYAARDIDTTGMLKLAVAALAALAAAAALALWLRRHPALRKWFLRGAAVLALAAVPVVLYGITHMYGGLTPEQIAAGIQPNGDSIYTYSIGYICRNIPGTVKLLVRSFAEQGALWLQGILGTTLGEPIVYRLDVSWLLGVGLILALLAAVLPRAGEPSRLGRGTGWGIAGVVLCVAALTFVAALSWTPINYTTIFGVQGRYWLPVLPLALVLVSMNRTFTVQRELDRRAVFCVLCLTSFVMLQGYDLYATWQPTI